jgi:hypothetical protein
MANYKAAASGNWSAEATWDGGAVPPNSAGHNIYANTFTVTVDTNINVALLTNTGVTGTTFVGGATAATAGGTFGLNDGRAIVATSINGPSATTSAVTVLYSGSTSASVTASVAITAGVVNGQHAVRHAGTGTLDIVGNCNGGGQSGNSGHAVYLSGTGTINITGNLVGGVGTAGLDSLGGTAVVNKSSGAGIINIVSGNVTGGPGQSYGIANIAGGAVNVLNGNVTAGTGVYGILQSGAGSVSVTGNISASSTAIGLLASAGTVTANGTFTALNGFNAISYSGQLVRASGSFIHSVNGTVPILAARINLLTTPTLAKTRYALNGTSTYVDMFTADNSLEQAVPSDVRSGKVYASGNLTGTCAVPAAGSVALGVPIDDTTGTAVLTPAAIRAELAVELARIDATVSSRLAPSGTLATVTTLTNAPTVPTPAQIATQVRSELSVELGRVDAAVSTRLATSGYTAPSTAPTAAANASAVRTELATELARVDAAVSTRLASSAYTAPANSDVTAIKAKTDLLETTRLAQCSTVATTGAQLAAALS